MNPAIRVAERFAVIARAAGAESVETSVDSVRPWPTVTVTNVWDGGRVETFAFNFYTKLRDDPAESVVIGAFAHDPVNEVEDEESYSFSVVASASDDDIRAAWAAGS